MKRSGLFLFAFISVTYGQIVILGKCPAVVPLQNFDEGAFLGRWYEQERFLTLTDASQGLTKCNSDTYSRNENGTISIVNVGEMKNTKRTVEGHGTLENSNIAKLTVEFPSEYATKNYYVLDSDYTNWAAVFSCVNSTFSHINFAWILTREKRLQEENIRKAEAAFVSQGLSLKPFIKGIQEDYC